MEIKWTVEDQEDENILLKNFLKKHHISKRVLTKVKYRGGSLKVNGRHVRVREELRRGDIVAMTILLYNCGPPLSSLVTNPFV